MADAFKHGDIVQLRSGGPPMTIDRLPGEVGEFFSQSKTDYHCTWFKGATRDEGNFGEHLLRAFVPPAAKGN